VSARAEAAIRELPEVELAFTTVGSGSVKRSNEALIYTKLLHKSQRRATQKQLMIRARERIAGLRLPLEEFAVERIGIISFGARSAERMYSIRGPDIGRLQYYAGSLAERMRESGGYSDIYLSYETGRPEIALDITRDRAADLGVPAVQIGQTISALFAGVTVTTFEDGGERYDVRVQVRPEDRDDLGTLELVRVRSATGALVPLRNLVTPRIGSGPVQIDRESRTRAITLYGNLLDKAAGTADLEVQRFARELEIGGEYQFEAVGPSKRMRETVDAVVFAAGVALLAIYMILAAQFDSFLHPLVIMVCAPLSFAGAFAALQLRGATLDVMGQIAFLMLLGIVMKNGILLVDYTNTLRRRGMPLHEAALEAGITRMRPVLMTTASTICGMLPVAFGGGDGSEWRNPMGTVSIGGLAVSTLLTLVIVPVTYTLVEDGRSAIVRTLGTLAGGRRGEEAP
jgi:HAE1 family hydrophobic/amphiphilic exporter-1